MWEILLFEISGDITLYDMNLTETKAKNDVKKLNKKCSDNYCYQAFETKN